MNREPQTDVAIVPRALLLSLLSEFAVPDRQDWTEERLVTHLEAIHIAADSSEVLRGLTRSGVFWEQHAGVYRIDVAPLDALTRG